MSAVFGMPGIGGSLGKCALCGDTFLTEIILGKSVQTFTLSPGGQKLFGHDDCMKKYEGKQAIDLPPASPIRQRYEAQQKERESGDEGTK